MHIRASGLELQAVRFGYVILGEKKKKKKRREKKGPILNNFWWLGAVLSSLDEKRAQSKLPATQAQLLINAYY